MRPPLLVGLCVFNAFATGAQSVPRLLYVAGADGAVTFSEVRRATHHNGTLAVLTPPTPAVHVRSQGGTWSEWGRQGRGPGDIADPVDALWNTDGALILDQSEHRLSAFTATGKPRATRSLGESWANRVSVIGSDTLLHVFVPMTETRAVLRMRGTVRDTVFRYESARESEKLRLAAVGAPSLTVTKPYTPVVQWAPVPNAGFAVWTPGASDVQLYDVSGKVLRTVRVSTRPIQLTADDREQWLRTAIPESFMGRKVFEPLRAEARARVAFPAQLPVVLQLLGSASGDVWVKRTTAGSGELWERAGSAESFRLPVGRSLLQIDGTTLVATSKTEDEEPVVEVYSLAGKPQR